ncbi:MAG: NUDIX hydrolase [Candidatus Micrarchaeota archaeon]|nr:NUDIX hydrolase [Candidatus Micrarchaeota archaeon]
MQVHAAVKAFVVRDGKILLLRERVGGVEVADFPGGKVEYGESAGQALERELMEELGVRPVSPKIVGSAYFFRRTDKHQILATVFECGAEGEIRLTPGENEELVGYEWVSPQELVGKKYDIHESFKKIIRERFKPA